VKTAEAEGAAEREKVEAETGQNDGQEVATAGEPSAI